MSNNSWQFQLSQKGKAVAPDLPDPLGFSKNIADVTIILLKCLNLMNIYNRLVNQVDVNKILVL